MLNEFLNIYESGLKDGQKSLTQPEAIHRLSEKINLLIYHFNLLEDNCNTSIKDFSEKVEYYLNNGMIDEVSKKLDDFVDDGTLNEIINKQIFDDINEQIKIIKSDITNFKETYKSNKTETDNAITSNSNAISQNATKIQANTDEITRVGGWLTTVENKVTAIQNNYTTVEYFYPDSGNTVQKYVLEDNKMAKIKKHYIHCQLSAGQWKEAWENISAGTNNNNGSIWIPFHWAINKNNIIDTTLTLKDINKWNWQSLGHSKIGIYGLGGINETGCYVYIENKDPSESTIGIGFSITITETY